ncbi:MAG: hypothetical protein ABIR27_00895 [Dokdonella sp.]
MIDRETGDALIAGEDVRRIEPAARDDLSDWIELMEVVEALCPQWPPQRVFVGKLFLL